MKHDREFDPRYGQAVEIRPGIRRMTVQNPGPFTFHGTNTYLVGTRHVAVIDPGPADPEHIDAIVKAVGPAGIDAILVSHTHADHSPGARLLKQRCGAPIVGCGPHRPARVLLEGEVNALDASGDKDHVPDHHMQDGEKLDFGDAVLEAVVTPGHTANHLCFALQGTDILFSADHVMAWSTSIVAPPDGSMRAYMASLDKLLSRPEQLFLPGHGGPVVDAADYMAQLKAHRMAREQSLLSALAAGPALIPGLVLGIYEGLDPALRPAAALSLFAHLEDLADRGLVRADPAVTLTGRYTLTG